MSHIVMLNLNVVVDIEKNLIYFKTITIEPPPPF